MELQNFTTPNNVLGARLYDFKECTLLEIVLTASYTSFYFITLVETTLHFLYNATDTRILLL